MSFSCNKKMIRCFICMLLSASISLFAEISLPHLNGLTSSMNPNYVYASPAIGALYWYSKYPEHLYRYGDESSATIKLTKELFFVHHDNVTFDVTYSPIKFAYYLDTRYVATILGIMLQYYEGALSRDQAQKKIDDVVKGLVNEQKVNIKGRITDRLAKNVQRAGQNVAQARITLLTFLNTYVTDRNRLEKTFCQLEDAWNWEDINVLLGILRDPEMQAELSASQRQEIQTRLEAFNKQRKRLRRSMMANQQLLDAEQKTEEIGNRYFNQSAKGFASLLMQSVTEELAAPGVLPAAARYIPYNTAALLLAFVWKKARNDELQVYFETLAKSSEYIIVERLLPVPYTSADYDKLEGMSPAEIATLPLDALIFVRLGFDIYKNPLPPLIGMTNAYYRDPYYTFPDCGETALRNFLDAVLYDPKSKTFSIELLKKLNAIEPLIDFYEKYKTAEHIRSSEAHNHWALVVSGLPGVNYLRQFSKNIGHEIDAGIRNMLAVIQALLPGITSFEDLVVKIAPEIKMGLRYEKDDPAFDKNNTITFTIERAGIPSVSLTWLFRPEHFEITYPPLIELEHAARYVNFLKTALIKRNLGKKASAYWVLLGSYSPEEYMSVLDTATTEQEQPVYRYLGFMLRPLVATWNQIETVKSIMQLANSGTMHPSFEVLYATFVHALYNQLPPTDEHTQGEFFDALLEGEFPAHVPATFFDKVYTWLQNQLPLVVFEDIKVSSIDKILEKPLPTGVRAENLSRRLNNILAQTLKTIEGPGRVLAKGDTLLSIILTKDFTDVPERVQNMFIGPYKWAVEQAEKHPLSLNEITMILDKRKKIPEHPRLREYWFKFYEAVKKSLPEFDMSATEFVKLARFISQMPLSPEENRDLVWTFYTWLNRILPNVYEWRHEESWPKDIMIMMLEKPILFATEFEKDLLLLRLNIVKGSLDKIEKPWNIIELIHAITSVKEIIEKESEQQQNFFRPIFDYFYSWIPRALSTVKSDFSKARVMANILNLQMSNFPNLAAWQCIYEEISKALPNFDDKLVCYEENAKKYLIEKILEKPIPENEQQRRIFSILLQTVVDTIKKIRDPELKREIIGLLPKMPSPYPDLQEIWQQFKQLQQEGEAS